MVLIARKPVFGVFNLTGHAQASLFIATIGSATQTRGSLMKPKWQKLASLAQEICTL